jgi:hypothetical protein
MFFKTIAMVFKMVLYRPEGGPAQISGRLSICPSVLLCQLGVFAITIMALRLIPYTHYLKDESLVIGGKKAAFRVRNINDDQRHPHNLSCTN